MRTGDWAASACTAAGPASERGSGARAAASLWSLAARRGRRHAPHWRLQHAARPHPAAGGGGGGPHSAFVACSAPPLCNFSHTRCPLPLTAQRKSRMPFARQVSIGRVCLIQYPEADAGKLVVISDVVSPNAVSACSPRPQLLALHLVWTPQQAPVQEGPGRRRPAAARQPRAPAGTRGTAGAGCSMGAAIGSRSMGLGWRQQREASAAGWVGSLETLQQRSTGRAQLEHAASCVAWRLGFGTAHLRPAAPGAHGHRAATSGPSHHAAACGAVLLPLQRAGPAVTHVPRPCRCVARRPWSTSPARPAAW